jgi:hypothetical protein
MEYNKRIKEGSLLMINFFTILFTYIILFNSTIAVASEIKLNHDLSQMDCYELMYDFISESTLNDKFEDKNLALELFFERYTDRYLELTFIKRSGIDKDGVYGNFEIDLQEKTLSYIDPDPSQLIKINKEYIPYIAKQCTPDKNLYANNGRLPDSNGD